jgi:hypothetical protein
MTPNLIERVDGIEVPVDPFERVMCESCQQHKV